MNNLTHEITVNKVAYTSSTDTFVNIQKRKEFIKFKSISAEKNVNLSYVQSQDLLSSENLTIDDRSIFFVQNRSILREEDQILENVSSFTLETDAFLVTDVFTSALNSDRRIPLFFNHSLQAVLLVGESYLNINILDKDFKPISSSLYSVLTSGSVYNNLVNTFDPITGLSKIYYVSYMIQKTSGVLQHFIEILNNAPVFRPADFDDIDPDTGFLFSTSKTFLITESLGSVFTVSLPLSGDYAIRRTSNSRLEVLEPSPTPSNEPWFVKIRNGSFLATGNTGLKKYHLAEFASQTFVPFFPYKQTDETSIRVSPRIIKTIQDRIVLSASQALYPEVIVYKEDGTVRFALTSNPLRVGLEAFGSSTVFANSLLGTSTQAGQGVDTSSNAILGSSIDGLSGFIVLPAGFEIKETDTVRTKYNFEESDYLFSLIDFNPTSSAEIINQRVALVIRPEQIGSTLTKTLYFLIVNEDGLVLETNIDFSLAGLDGIDVQTLITATGLWYGRAPDDAPWAEPIGYDFVNDCTVEGTNNQDDILILGDVYVKNSIAPESLTLNDIRVRGGGITLAQQEEECEFDSQCFWDLSNWDGQPFPGHAAIFVDLPIELLSITESGVLSPENINEIVNRHIALGVYPVIHAYDTYMPVVTGLNYLPSGVIEVSWTSGPIDSRFSVFTSETQEGEFLLQSGNMTETSFTFSGLDQSYFNILGYPEGSDLAFIDGPIFDVEVIEL